jgi:uncharacterized protein
MKTYADIVRLAPQIKAIAAKYDVHEVQLFGSLARGEQTVTSDVDLMINPPETLSLFSFVHLQSELQELIGVKTDLATKNNIHPFIKDRVFHEAIIL